MTIRFKRIVSHFYIAALTAAFILTFLDSENWWLIVLTYLAMCIVAHLFEKEEKRYAKIQSRSNRQR